MSDMQDINKMGPNLYYLLASFIETLVTNGKTSYPGFWTDNCSGCSWGRAVVENSLSSAKLCVEVLKSQTLLCSHDNCANSSELLCSLLCSGLDFSGSSNHGWCSLYTIFGFSDKWLWWLGKGKSGVVNCLFCCVFFSDVALLLLVSC